MPTQFNEDYPKYRAKIEKFIEQTSFHQRLTQYREHLNQMNAINTEDIQDICEKEPAFLNARNESIRLMEEIIETQKSLKEIFELDQEALGEFCEYDLKRVNKEIAGKIKHATQLLYDYEIVSQLGQKILEKAHKER